MTSSPPQMIDLFAGAGGLSCGLEQSGFKSILANEMVPQYAETYQLNHVDSKVICGDIRQIDEDEIHNLVKEHGDIDLIAGGPPCQGYSINAPVRTMEDYRNHLFEEYLRIVSKIQPKVVLIENVPGIVSMSDGDVVRSIYSRLNSMGYNVDHRILFAGHYGVPQMRFRTIFIASRILHEPIIFPEPKYNSKAVQNFKGSRELCMKIEPLFAHELKKQTTVWDAIGDLPEVNMSNKSGYYDYPHVELTDYQKYCREGSDGVYNHYCNKMSKINEERLKYIPIGGSWRDIPFDLLPEGLKRARRSDHTRRYGRLDPNSLGTTIMTKCDPHWGTFFHPYSNRIITVREAARIQSFPDTYHFTGTMTEQFAQVGNAVPPLMAKEIGNSIMEMMN